MSHDNITCCCCDKEVELYKTTNGLLGRLCDKCVEVARAGSQPVYITRVKGVSQKTGRWTYSRQLVRSFQN